MGYPRYQAVHTEEGADLEGFIPSEADCRLIQVYVNHVHHNDGRHIDRVISDNNILQVRWRILFRQTGLKYRAPQGTVGQRFMKCLLEEFRGARKKLWSEELLMVFMGMILQKTPRARKANNISAGSLGTWVYGILGKTPPSVQIPWRRSNCIQQESPGEMRR